ncbi:metal ABC transporter solute-binding protein, Zn/Mn family [Methylocella sp.]|uniref:metal ABC transporter solute-binding protein, Zn/Mn family n=1 Tax=Methylocella sp. TaxID=1978226 RepID=UPI0037840B57
MSFGPLSFRRFSRRGRGAAALAAALVLSLSMPAAARTLEVVASFSVLADMAREVGGDHVHVTSLVPPNGDPHEFEPTPDDAKRLRGADVALTSGLGLEGWFARLAKASGYAGKPVVASDGIRPLKMDEDGAVVADPHVWNAIPNALVMTRNIEAALSAAAPGDAAAFKKNAEAYEAKLKALDAYARAEIDAIPKNSRKVLTTHDALGYFGAAYGVEFLSPLGITTGKDPSAAQMAKLIRQIRAEGVRVYFFENSSDPRLVRQIAAATGAQPGGELYVESLSGPDGPAPTYAAMFRYNVDTLVAAMKAAQKS